MIELAASLITLASAFTGGSQEAQVTVHETHTEPATLETYVREYFKETPILAEVAYCESRFTHLNKDGTILRGRVNADDVGVMQINEEYHLEDSEKMNIDIHSLEGNLEYAKILYGKFGSKPWKASKPCWGKYETGHLAKAQ